MAIPGNLLSAVTEMVDPDTSGWTVVQNCTKSLGSGGRNGDGCLALTATAAAEMQARTTASYPVSAGTTYQTFADASSSTEPERIGIQWLDATSAQISITWSLTTDTASSTWHRIGVAGVAPVGAVQARVILSSTATAVGHAHYFENVYLGQPFRVSSNLLSFNVESGGEIDASGWAVDTNATITRDAPAASWAVNWYYSGGEVIKMAAAASGNASIKTAEAPTVEPGVEYTGYCYINPPNTSASCWIEIRWLDGTGTLISAKRAVLAAPGTGFYRQITSGIAPAGAASAVLAVGITSATSGLALRIEGAVIERTTPLYVGSSVPLEDADFEAGVGSWTVTSGVATIARSTPWGAALWTDSYALTITSTTATSSLIVSAKYPVTAGVNWRSAIFIRSTSGGAWTASLVTRYYDVGGTSLGTSTPDPEVIPANGNFWSLTEDTTTPTGSVTARFEITLTAPAANAVAHIDGVGLFQTLASFEVDPDDGTGSATLIIRELTTGDTMTLYRISGGTQSLVRGADGWIQDMPVTSAQFTVEDYEAPLETPFSYRADLTESNGAPRGNRTSPIATITVPDPSDCWIKDPLQPERNVLLRASVAPDWSRPIEQTEYRVRNRRNSVILSDVRGGLTGTVQVWTMSDTEREALHFALDTGDTLLLQFPPDVGIGDAYYAVGDVSENRWSPVGSEPRRIWSLALTQVDAPIGGVSGTAGWTVQDVLSTWDTVMDVLGAYATVIDLAVDNREA